MFQRSSIRNTFVVLGLVVLLLAGTAVTGVAQTNNPPKATTAAQPANAAASSAQVAVDPATHQLRQPTAEEAQALAAQMKSARTAKALKAVKHSNGSKSVALSDQFMETMVARVNADGSISEACVETPAEAEAFVTADPKKATSEKSKPAATPALEER